MSAYFKLNIEKSLEVVHYVLQRTGNVDFHKLCKILYFAEQKHLKLYGRPIMNDCYVAMRHGPVPSFVYDVLTCRREGITEMQYNNQIVDISEFDVVKYFVESRKAPQLDYLSGSDIECLDESILENIDLDFLSLTQKSHDNAWHNSGRDDRMSIFDIAEAGGANNEILKYISCNIENSMYF